MESLRQYTPLIVVVGPTASGKSTLALELAKKFGGEIICADSRTIYKDMDIGTAKPGEKDREEVRHHILDVVSPDETFTAAKFKELAVKAMGEIIERGNLPIMVGGTGLYIDGVIFDYAFLPPADNEEREFLQSLSVEQLQQKLNDSGIPMPANKSNPRHLIRAIETNGAVPVKGKLRERTLIIGLDISKDEIKKRIESRTELMIKNGLEAEVKQLARIYGWGAPGLSAVGYREWSQLDGQEEIINMINYNTLQYAKRQRTWFRRNPSIKWIKNSAEAVALVKEFLQNTA